MMNHSHDVLGTHAIDPRLALSITTISRPILEGPRCAAGRTPSQSPYPKASAQLVAAASFASRCVAARTDRTDTTHAIWQTPPVLSSGRERPVAHTPRTKGVGRYHARRSRAEPNPTLVRWVHREAQWCLDRPRLFVPARVPDLLQVSAGRSARVSRTRERVPNFLHLVLDISLDQRASTASAAHRQGPWVSAVLPDCGGRAVPCMAGER